jgi:hypothetical protein
MAIILNGTGFISGAAGIGTGGNGQAVFFESDKTITSDYTIGSNKNAMSAGPIEIAVGITVTIPIGSDWSIV